MSNTLLTGATYFGSMLTALIATPVVLNIARRCGIVDLPGARKVHQVPTPRIGGLAVAIAVLGIVVPCFLLMSWTTHEIGGDRARFATLLLCSFFILLVGLVDDIFNISAMYKLLALVLAAIAFCSAGGVIHELNYSGHHAIALGVMSWPVTILWIVAVTVSINFMDGLDGLAAGIVAIACGVIAIGAAISWQVPALLLSLALLGSLTGFLVYNFHPAKVFMGDCGSMFIGFTLAACGVLYAQRGTKAGGLLLPALALAIPFADLLLTMVRRGVLQRRSLFAAERGHIHHRLMDIGLRHHHAVLILYIATTASAVVGLMSLFRTGWIYVGSVVLMVPAIFSFFRAAGSVRGRETLSAVRRNRAIGRETRRNQHTFEEIQLRFRNVRSFEEWREQIFAAAEMLGMVQLTLPLLNRDGTPNVLRWRRSDPAFLECESVKVFLPIRDRRTDRPINAEIELAVNTTLESTGQRLALFARLMSEHSLAELAKPMKQASKGQLAVQAELRRRRLKIEKGDQRREGNNPMGVKPKIAIVHDFLYTYAGAERVLEQMIEVFPDAEIYSLFDFLPADQREFIRGKKVTTSFIQKLPFARSKHRAYLPLMPLAIEQLDVSAYDIVISSSYCVAKGVLTRPDQLHICYCHTPMRFAWDLQHQYLAESGLIRGLKSLMARIILHYARTWDARSANGVDVFVTNSDFIGRRIEKVYRRPSTTLHPPVDVETFKPGAERADFYVTASRMVPYKRIDLIVEAFTATPERKLIVVGDGPEMEKIAAKAGPNVKLVGHQPLSELRRYLQLAKAFVFAAEEDFGICVVEAQACGTPVIALRRGGAVETVVPNVTGVFFDEQSIEGILVAVEEFEAKDQWDGHRIRQNAERFSNERFRRGFEQLVMAQWQLFKATRPDRAPTRAGDTIEEPIGLPADGVFDPATALSNA
jgi:UDP-N-acetylmuramyl pentapeptide phosphotransferase/UDP-N-acetylglucosamine-1-phosphate transferase/glycosyltransferase involved in cell wall biosynthesis